MPTPTLPAIAAFLPCAAATLVLAACGGGGEEPPPESSGPALAVRMAAASATAQSTTNACAPIGSFHWEIGDANGVAGFGAVRRSASAAAYSRDTVLEIASASKWLYGIAVAQQRGGVLTAGDVQFLTFLSGYTQFDFCRSTGGGTVRQCAEAGSNGVRTPAAVGRYFYGGSHQEQHALANGWGAISAAALGPEMKRWLGGTVNTLTYERPWLSGGATTTAADDADVMRGVLSGRLAMKALLGTSAVCTNPSTCATALFSPVTAESDTYSIGHWVESDPAVGDGAFSSAGAYGFYPWIDATKSWYGIVARQTAGPGEQGGVDSMMCGRLIRKAWLSGTAL